MKKSVYNINFDFHFEPIAHKGAPYSFDGLRWMNKGDFLECADKLCKGFSGVKDGNTPFDKDSDIPETSTSVKSGKATLTSVSLGNDYQTIKDNYFSRVHSTNWDFVVMVDSTIVIYNMDKDEFSAFMDRFTYFDKDRCVIRFKAYSSKMGMWLDKKSSHVPVEYNSMESNQFDPHRDEGESVESNEIEGDQTEPSRVERKGANDESAER